MLLAPFIQRLGNYTNDINSQYVTKSTGHKYMQLCQCQTAA